MSKEKKLSAKEKVLTTMGLSKANRRKHRTLYNGKKKNRGKKNKRTS